jgi:putative ABC transport system permease protein
MNLMQLVMKQVRQRALSTWLTLLSVLLGVTLVIAILIIRREGAALFGQTDYGFDVLVGAKSSPLQLTMNTIYHLDKSPGNIPYSIYEELDQTEAFRSQVGLAIPFAVGDSYEGLRIVATSPKMFGVTEDGTSVWENAFEYRPGQRYQLAEGRVFHPRKFEAVIGSETARLKGLKVGDQFKATHGMPAAGETPDVHDEQWTVVGILQPTHTANDRILFIPMVTFYCIGGHGDALESQAKIKAGEDISSVAAHHHHHDHKHYTMAGDGTITITIPREKWQLSAVLVRGSSSFATQQLLYIFSNRDDATAVNPASVMREFFRTFLDGGAKVLLLISGLVTLVAAASIMTTIYNSVSARRKEMAIIRALGATRQRILMLICLEAVLIGIVGGALGLVSGHLLSAGGSAYMQRMVGEGMNWLAVGPEEWWYLAAVVLLSLFAGLVPALKAYSTPVAEHLVVG